MGRKKITIDKITDVKTRQVTFNKRKVGLMKKAMELSILCDCDIALIVFSSDNQLYQYSSKPIDEVLRRYRAYDGGYECLVNRDLQDLKPGRASSFKVGAKRRKTASAVTPRTPKGGRPPRPFTAESPKLNAAATPSSSSFQMNSPLGAGSGAMSTHMPKLGMNPVSAILPPADNPFDSKSPAPSISITSPTGSSSMPTGAKDKDRFARLSVQVPPKQSAAAVVEVVDTRTTPSSASASGLASAVMSAEAGKSGDPFPTPGTFLVATRPDGSTYSAPASAIPLSTSLLFNQPSAGLAPSPGMDFLQTPGAGALFFSQFGQGPLSAMGGQFPLNLAVGATTGAVEANGSSGTKTDGTAAALPTPVHPPVGFPNPALALQQQMMMRQLQMQAYMQAQAGADPSLYAASLGLPANTSAAASTNSASPSPSASSASSSSVTNSTATNSQSSSSVTAAAPNGVPPGLPLPGMFNMMDPLAFAGFPPAFYATTPGANPNLLTSPGAFPSPVPWNPLVFTADPRRFASPGALTREGIFAAVMGAAPSAAAASAAAVPSNSAAALRSEKS